MQVEWCHSARNKGSEGNPSPKGEARDLLASIAANAPKRWLGALMSTVACSDTCLGYGLTCVYSVVNIDECFLSRRPFAVFHIIFCMCDYVNMLTHQLTQPSLPAHPICAPTSMHPCTNHVLVRAAFLPHEALNPTRTKTTRMTTVRGTARRSDPSPVLQPTLSLS